MNRVFQFILLLAIGHGVNDFIAGWLLAGSMESKMSMYYFPVYGILAFGGQLPVALLIERRRHYKAWTQLALALMIAALIFVKLHVFTAIILSGIASAIYHVAGGALSLILPKNKAGSSGLFAAPGVIGLVSGGILVSKASLNPYILIVAPLVLLLLISVLKPEAEIPDEKNETRFDLHDGIMLLLLMIVALRSSLWDIYHAAVQGQFKILIALALAAAAGKLIGGILSDRFNQPRFLILTTAAAVVLLQFAQKNWAFLLAGVALLQSSIPASVVMIWRMMRKYPAVASGLVLGFCVVSGAALLLIDNSWLPAVISVFLVLLTTIFFWLARKKIN